MPSKVAKGKTQFIAVILVVIIMTVIGATVLSQTFETPQGTVPMLEGRVNVGGTLFTFNPTEVETVRPDIFNPGYFSMFDVLVHLDDQGLLELVYHFDESVNTHIVDSVNGELNWWYRAAYGGGWSENNVFRPDHYPWKDGTSLTFFTTNPSTLEDIYSVWRDEVTRRENNGGFLVIPQVTIRGNSFTKSFSDVLVTPHNLRNDVFRENVTTAIDVILSLGDQEAITYSLKWYERIDTASIVKDYWVEAIDGDRGFGRAGFVYEAGAAKYEGFIGNHIHLPSDTRILNSPEYVEFFWISI